MANEAHAIVRHRRLSVTIDFNATRDMSGALLVPTDVRSMVPTSNVQHCMQNAQRRVGVNNVFPDWHPTVHDGPALNAPSAEAREKTACTLLLHCMYLR